MTWRDWGERGARPIRVDGGLVARSDRGAIGTTWWSQRFIAVLESFDLGGRLTRGRSYARQGQVLSLDVGPGIVAASVQGSRPTPYTVSIGFAVLDDDTWSSVEHALAAEAGHRASLLAGEIPPDLEEVFAAAGASLFPRRSSDLVMRCTCPDPVTPCKHIAATVYLLAERFDDDPFAVLLWRGRSREELLADLADAGPRAPTHSRRADAADPAAVLADLPAVDVGAAPDRYWLSPVPLPARPATLDAGPDLLLRVLPDPPGSMGGKATADELRRLYLALPDPRPAGPAA